MGTFHDDKGELHGVTVVVDTAAGQLIVGRCHEANDQHVVIMDADVFEEAPGGPSRQDWLSRAAKWGVHPRHKALRVDAKNVTKITPLNQL